MKMTLLEKAKTVKTLKKTPENISPEMQELAIAWVKNEVTLKQVGIALGLNNTPFRLYSKLAIALKEYMNDPKSNFNK